MADRLGVRYDEISIVPEFEAFKASLAPVFEGLPEDTTEENIQARIRGMLLMALSNKFGGMRADHRQQERDGHRLLHAVRRHGRRLCRHQGPAQDHGLPAGALAQYPRPHGTGISPSPSASSPAAQRRAAARPDRPGQPAAVRGARRDPGALHGERPGRRGDHRRGVRAGRGGAGGPPDPRQRVQAPPGAGGHPRRPTAAFGQGLALSYQARDRFRCRLLKDRAHRANDWNPRRRCHETDHRRRQTLQARGSPRGRWPNAA